MLALRFKKIDIYGMKLGDFAVSARSDGGQVVVDPIEASLNGGRVRLEPVVEQGEDGLWTLRARFGVADRGCGGE